jgi:3-oxo-5-alpha-steroid 4-dehydrogenase 1
MPLSIMAMGILFNTINGYIQGEWIFFLAPEDMYTTEWLTTPQFIIGTIIFFIGMGINLNSDHVIRNLRAPGDTKHYLPKKNMYRYVTSANYFGEIVEWTGFAILTWSLPGLIFVLWTCANLVPRANSIYHKYKKEFGDEFNERKLKRIFPFIY